MADLLDTNSLSAIVSDIAKGPGGGTPFWVAAGISIAILFAIVYFVFLKNKKPKEPVPRVPHVPHHAGAPEENQLFKADVGVQKTVEELAKTQSVLADNKPYPPVSPVAQNQPVSAAKPAKQTIADSKQTTPRRLRRFERQEQKETGDFASPARRGRWEKTVPTLMF